jgi:hypothetical protein
MLVICGALPIKDSPLIVARPKLQNGFLALGTLQVPCTMGTAAMVSTAIIACEYLGVEGPTWVTAGDIGKGDGSRLMYDYLADNLPKINVDVLCFHYIMPMLTPMRKVVDAVRNCQKRPLLIADAGGIYAAKAAGLATEFDVFTPDAGEMAFLADPKATHPAYMGRHLFESDTQDIPKLIQEAYKYNNAPKILMVKNPVDHIAKNGQIIATINEPNIPTLEPIGGTGDTIAGMISALVSAGYDPCVATIVAAKTNRMAGKFANPKTRTKICEIITQIPKVFDQYLDKWSKDAVSEGCK